MKKITQRKLFEKLTFEFWDESFKVKIKDWWDYVEKSSHYFEPIESDFLQNKVWNNYFLYVWMLWLAITIFQYFPAIMAGYPLSLLFSIWFWLWAWCLAYYFVSKSSYTVLNGYWWSIWVLNDKKKQSVIDEIRKNRIRIMKKWLEIYSYSTQENENKRFEEYYNKWILTESELLEWKEKIESVFVEKNLLEEVLKESE